MFGKSTKYKKAANALGPHVHKQIVSALEARDDVFSTPDEMAFVAGYLGMLMWVTLDKQGCKDWDVQASMLKHVCNGVIPGRLWDIVERGEALGSPFFGDAKPEYKSAQEAYKLGSECGTYDSIKLDDAGFVPQNLRRYLVGEAVEKYT